MRINAEFTAYEVQSSYRLNMLQSSDVSTPISSHSQRKNSLQKYEFLKYEFQW